MTQASQVKTLEILGTGQLASMLGDACTRLKLPFRKHESLQNLQGSLFTFENELVDVSQLVDYWVRNPQAKFLPSLECLKLLQNKNSQKAFCENLKLPITPFSDLGDPTAVLKWATQGYDGRGTWIPNQTSEDRSQFLQRAKKKGVEVYAEKKVDFARELACVAAVTALGECVVYPVVETHQEKGVCRKVQGPLNFRSTKRVQEILRILLMALHKKGYCGVLALECFETKGGKIFINELAPRVHNSAHYSLDACSISQFENHVRAVIGLPLQAPHIREGFAHFAMLNFLGPCPLSPPTLPDYARPHWYGKDEARAGRKMGHCCFGAESERQLKTRIDEVLLIEKQWLNGKI